MVDTPPTCIRSTALDGGQRAGGGAGRGRCSPRSAAPSTFDLTTLSVALRQLRNLSLTSIALYRPAAAERCMASEPSARSDCGRAPVALAGALGSVNGAMADAPRFRFAPSPTGFFHVGGARTALLQLGAGPPARRHVRAAHRGHRRGPQPTRSGRRASSTRWRGSASPPTTRPSRARTSRATTPPPTSPPPSGLFDRGHAYYCDLTAEEIQAAVEGERSPRLRRLLARPRARARARAACCASGRPTTARRSSTTSSAATVDLRQRDDRGLRAAAQQRHADVPARQRRRRHRDGHHRRGARRGAPAEHAQAAAAVGGARARRRRSGPTCRCSSTSSARSCRSDATRWRSSSTATRATSPTRWSTT